MHNEEKAEFWHSSWIDGQSPKNIAPLIFARSKRKNFWVKQGLNNHQWLAYLEDITTHEELLQLVELWDKVKHIQLTQDEPDKIMWRWTTNGQYTANSAYKVQFHGTTMKHNMSAIWKAKIQPKCKVFAAPPAKQDPNNKQPSQKRMAP